VIRTKKNLIPHKKNKDVNAGYYLFILQTKRRKITYAQKSCLVEFWYFIVFWVHKAISASMDARFPLTPNIAKWEARTGAISNLLLRGIGEMLEPWIF
jgi:hypothetical protein